MGGYFEVDSKKEELEKLNNITKKSDFWNDTNRANEIFSKIKALNKIINSHEEISITIEILKEEFDQNEYDAIVEKLNELEINTYLSGEYDNNACYLEIHPGAGGTESCDWASMISEMYKRYFEKNSYKYEVISESSGEEAGIKETLIKVSGNFAYGYLKNESGVHRLVRISPFDSNKRRHTSFASVSVTPEFDNEINLDIKEEDLKIDVYRSSGAGGQSVNTTDSAVRITHLPSKVVVTCQNERSQIKNKEVALKILKSKLYEIEMRKKEELESSMKDNSNINFGSQIRSYILEPYKLVKDHRTNFESHDPDKILNGFLKEILEDTLRNVR